MHNPQLSLGGVQSSSGVAMTALNCTCLPGGASAGSACTAITVGLAINGRSSSNVGTQPTTLTSTSEKGSATRMLKIPI